MAADRRPSTHGPVGREPGGVSRRIAGMGGLYSLAASSLYPLFSGPTPRLQCASGASHSVQHSGSPAMSVRGPTVMQFISVGHCELLPEPVLVASFFQQ